jgi:hypothetical protein
VRELAMGYLTMCSRLRWRALAVIGVLLVSVPLAWSLRMPDFHRSLALPPNRFVVVVCAAIASLNVLVLLPIIETSERTAVRNMRLVRLAAAAVLVGLILVLSQVVSVGTVPTLWEVTPVARNTAGLTGIALLVASLLSAPAGLIAPWLFALAGVLFGYQPNPGAAATVRPWAWILPEDGSGVTAAATLLVLGLACYAAFGIRGSANQ